MMEVSQEGFGVTRILRGLLPRTMQVSYEPIALRYHYPHRAEWTLMTLSRALEALLQV